MATKRDILNATLCFVGFVGVVLLLNPWVNTPFDDDFSYAYTVKQLLETGHLLYNGWSTASLITFAYWGAAWCKVFGFSFNTLRASTLPLAAGSLSLCYLLARKAGLKTWESFFVAALVGLSPLFLPLALSFMTDVPGLFCILLSLYALIRSAGKSRGLAWLAVGVVVAILGGMGRQFVWMVPLSVLPYLAIRWRRDTRFVVAALAGWLAVVAGAVLTMRWFNSQPNIMLDPLPGTVLYSAFSHPIDVLLISEVRIVLTLTLVLMPAAVCFAVVQLWLWRGKRGNCPGIVAIGVLALLALFFYFEPKLVLFPWLFDIIAPDGPLGNLELSGANPQTLSNGVIALVSGAAIVVLAASAIAAATHVREPRKTFAAIHRLFFAADENVALPVLWIFLICYSALLIGRMSATLVFDRYLLPIMPCAAILALLQLKKLPPHSSVHRLATSLGILLLVISSAYGLATQQSLIVTQRARQQAINTLLSHGVKPTEIAAGFEYDLWTQLDTCGTLNCYGTTNPIHPFDPSHGIAYALLPRYRVEHDVTLRTAHSEYPAIHYVTWLPPFHRTIYIDIFRDWQHWKDGSQPVLKDWEGS
jgi:hypothetical protein